MRDEQEEELAWFGIEALERAFENRERSVREVVEAQLARIERLDPRLQAFSALWPERALAVAARLDTERAATSAPLRALHGIPIVVKDLCDVKGEPTRAGTLALGDVPAAANAEVVDRLEAAGAVLLGKVKMTEGAFISHHPSVVPPVNPWNADRWTGISSSGSGVAVAGGLCTAALGTDTGGSIRYPSAACGLTGLKPTHGRVSLRGVFPLAESLDHIGPMARSASDAARLFAVLAGFDPRDPWSLEHNPPVASVSALAPNLRGTRIGVDRLYVGEGVDAEVVAALDSALEVLREAGAEIVEIRMPDLEEVLSAWIHLSSAEIATAHAATYPSRAELYGSQLRETLELGQQVGGRAVAHAWKTRLAYSRRLAARFEQVDAIAAPVIPARFAANTNLGDPARFPAAGVAMRFTSPFNLSGSPSLTLPCGFDGDGAPIGFQLAGPHLEETRLLALGMAYQARSDWHRRHPDL